MEELSIKGICISKDVVATIVAQAAEKVEGVARVGQNPIASSLISVFTAQPQEQEIAVESDVRDDKFVITVHATVFFGYQLVELAEDIREAVANSVLEQIGIEVAEVNVCIDGLVFPKEK